MTTCRWTDVRMVMTFCTCWNGQLPALFRASLAEHRRALRIPLAASPTRSFSTSTTSLSTYIMADSAHEQEEVQYQPKDAIGEAVQATMVTGTAGLFVSTIQNTLTKQNVGAFGVFTRSGGTIAVFGECGADLVGRGMTLIPDTQLPWEGPTNSPRNAPPTYDRRMTPGTRPGVVLWQAQ